MITVTMRVNTTLDKYQKAVEEKLTAVVKKNALSIQAKAAQNAPVKTGALRNSIQATEGKDALHYEISDGVEYGAAQELGTSRGIVAKHFLGGACETQADKFFDDVKEALK